MSDETQASSSDVFVNCPFDDDYKLIFDALIFTVFACEFRPRSALEIEDGSQPRIEKLHDIIAQCRYGIHDLSRTELDDHNQLPRFNMPLELGIFLGAKKFGDEAQRQKKCLILDVERYRYQKFISDLSGMDIRAHGGEPNRAIGCARDWLANVSRRALPSARLVQDAYGDFLAHKRKVASKLGFEENSIPYVDYERLVTAWLLEAPPHRTRRKKSD
ncbi:hypothetical protein U91I_00142 [alpha proteobacterium U9-1i]|nr:hypothetical protein U91I_00142 [alpha proteobacterium U9-1i]